MPDYTKDFSVYNYWKYLKTQKQSLTKKLIAISSVAPLLTHISPSVLIQLTDSFISLLCIISSSILLRLQSASGFNCECRGNGCVTEQAYDRNVGQTNYRADREGKRLAGVRLSHPENNDLVNTAGVSQSGATCTQLMHIV